MSSVHDRSEDDAVDGAASGGNQPSSDSQGFVFAGADGRFVTPELIELRPLPRRTPTWLKTALAAAGLGVAVIGWSLYGGSSSEPVETAAVPMARSDDELAEAKLAEEQRRHSTVESKEVQQHASVSHNDRDPLVQDLLARERARATAFEQQASGSPSDRDLLAQERSRRKELEQQLALRRNDAYLLAEEQAHSKELGRQLANDRELLARERTRSKELEQQLAVRQGDQKLLAQERARSKEFEQQLASRQNDRDQLTREQARSKELEQQLAARQGDQKLLAEERTHSKELEQQLAIRQNDRDQLAREQARSKELEQQLAARQADRELLVEERTHSKELEQQLAIRQADRDQLAGEWARSKELAQQLAALRGDDQDLLARERTRNKELEQQLAARLGDQELLVQERARTKELEQQLAARHDAPQTPSQAVRASDWPAMAPAQRPTTADAVRLIARAKLLIAQGDIGGARMVLERAAETGSAPALFALAETYDASVLSAWGTFGTQGDSARAQQLYAEAFAGGVQEAKPRLK